MNNKNLIRNLILGASLLVLFAGSVFAADPGGAGVSAPADQGSYTVQNASNVSVVGGNVYLSNLDSNSSTTRWAGVVGNTTGNIVLADAANNFLYSWTAEGNLVYASESASPAWTTLDNASVAQVTTAYTYLAGNFADNYTETFTGASEDIGSTIFTSVQAEYAQTLSQGGTYKTYSLWDGSSVVFAAKVDAGGVDYAGNANDFQLLLPDQTTQSDTTATTFNVWLELV